MQERLLNAGRHLFSSLTIGADNLKFGIIAIQEAGRLQRTVKVVAQEHAFELWPADPQQRIMLEAQLEREVVDRMLNGLANNSLRRKERILEAYEWLAGGIQSIFEENRREENRRYAQRFTKLANGLRALIDSQRSER